MTQFDEFFASGKEITLSPFLTKSSQKFAKNMSLKAGLLSAFLLLIAIGLQFHFPNLSHLSLVFVYFLSGTPALIASLEDIKVFNINIDVLMTLAALFSVVIGSGLEGGLLLVLFALSHAMEDLVMHKTKGALHHLTNLSPTLAIVIQGDGRTVEKSIKEVMVQDKILIKAGEIIPLDGRVVEGSSFVNMVHLTGEAVPIAKKMGDTVQAGSLNLDGFLKVEVTKTSSESTLAKIIELITEAHAAKPTLQKFLDRFGRPYALTIISLSLLFCFLLPLVFHLPFLGTEGAIYRSLAFLIAASPCALIIATPTAYLSAISACARRGILLKGGITLDAFAACESLAFDKTGTVTTGNLKLLSLDAFHEPVGHHDPSPSRGRLDAHNNSQESLLLEESPPLHGGVIQSPSTLSEDEAIAIAAALEQKVVHPIARAITAYAAEKNLIPIEVESMRSLPGQGIEGKVRHKGEVIDVSIGSYEYIRSLKNSPLFSSIDQKTQDQGVLVTLMRTPTSIYLFHFQDEIRKGMKQVISSLQKEHYFKTVMLTGDHQYNAEFVGKELGIDAIYADLKPDDKLKIVSDMASKGALAMIGDGANDGPALARAHVGISMGQIGSQTAVEASDIVILNDDLSLLPWLAKKARTTMKIVKQNLSLALIVIFLATTPALLGYIPLWMAVILHEGGTIIVGLNSLRLLRKS